MVKGIHEQVFDALVEAGHPQAVIARDAQAQFDEQAAWREVIRDTIEGAETGAGLTALFKADREGFESLMATNADPVRDADTAVAVRKLDRISGIGQPQAAGGLTRPYDEALGIVQATGARRVWVAPGHGSLSRDLGALEPPRIPAHPHEVKEDPTTGGGRASGCGVAPSETRRCLDSLSSCLGIAANKSSSARPTSICVRSASR